MKRNFCMIFFILMTFTLLMAVNNEEKLLKSLDEETVDNLMRTMWLYQDGEYDYENIDDEVLSKLLSEKNSNAVYGEKMKFRFSYLLDNPDGYTPGYGYKYDTFIKYCDELSPHQAYVLSQFMGLDSDKGYEEIPAKPDIRFPRDHAIQYDFQVGWHFFVGNCLDKNGVEYGIQLMFWRYSLLPAESARKFGLTDEENQITEMHLAISRAGDRHYSARPTVVGGTSGLTKFKNDPFDYSFGKNRIYSLEENFAPLKLVAKGWDDTEEEVEIEIDITIDQNKKPVLNGDNGASPSVGGVGTLYYSITNMKLVPETSFIKINGEKIELSKGKFWFDHQWANGLAPQGNPRDLLIRTVKCLTPPTPPGWDWFMVQFKDDTEMGLSAIHSEDNISFYYQTGEEPPATMTADMEGKYVDKDGNAVDVKGKLIISEWIKATTSTNARQFWVTDTWYPNHWEFVFDGDNVPEDKRHFFMRPIVDNGQYAFFGTGAQYSEGGTYVENEIDEIIGMGFAESVAYADTTENMLFLTGMPATREVRNAIKPAVVTDQLKLWSLLYIYMSPERDKILGFLKNDKK